MAAVELFYNVLSGFIVQIYNEHFFRHFENTSRQVLTDFIKLNFE